MPIKFSSTLAHAPFYDTAVAFLGTRTVGRVNVTVDCCIFEDGFDTPFADENTDSTRHVVGIAFPLLSWRYPTPPQIGETVRFGAKDYRVSKVEESLGDYHLTAREVE